jgi:formiminotetrahydrofolate cyclodeaminase
MSEHDFGSLTLDAFRDVLGSDTPTPGGGSGAAVTGAMGASLVRMLAVLTTGRKKYVEHEPLMQAIAEQAAEEGAKLMALATEDAGAYDAVSRSFKLPRESDEEKAARTSAIQDALKGACEVPLRIMERCCEVIALAKNAVLYGNTNAISDGAAGAELARAALKVASYNVRINLGSIKDADYVKAASGRMDEMLHMGIGAATYVDGHVSEMWSAPA